MSDTFGIMGTAKCWFASYLSGRTSRCKVTCELSEPQTLKYGVPQGSVVGPQLFNMYTKPLSDIIRLHKGVQFHSYADDVQLYIFADPRQADSMAQALHSLSACMEDILAWMQPEHVKPEL